tara:strand:+ start:303 stop:509 length:207 start_codon:yes stop_codon:yes gene_type:complete
MINNKDNDKKKVTFNEMCKVVLIPSRQEYSHAGISLWYTQRNYHHFKLAALIENQQQMAEENVQSTSL